MNENRPNVQTAPRIRIQPTRDLVLLDRIARENYAAIKDDHCPADPQAFTLAKTVDNPRNFFLRVSKDHRAVGYFAFLRCQNPTVYQVHTVLGKECRGRLALMASAEALRYVFTKTDCSMLTSFCPEDNKPSLIFAKLNGFTVTAETKDFLRNGQTIGRTWVALNKTDWKGKQVCH